MMAGPCWCCRPSSEQTLPCAFEIGHVFECAAEGCLTGRVKVRSDDPGHCQGPEVRGLPARTGCHLSKLLQGLGPPVVAMSLNSGCLWHTLVVQVGKTVIQPLSEWSESVRVHPVEEPHAVRQSEQP